MDGEDEDSASGVPRSGLGVALLAAAADVAAARASVGMSGGTAVSCCPGTT